MSGKLGADGLNIQIFNQPPKNTDMNVSNIGYLKAIQSLQIEWKLRNMEYLIEVVENAVSPLHP